jgi:hypothetical protein
MKPAGAPTVFVIDDNPYPNSLRHSESAYSYIVPRRRRGSHAP